MEQQLAAIWAGVLQRDRVGIYDNFFDLGGHSLLAVRMMVQARSALAITLPVAAVFAAPTIAELAERGTRAAIVISALALMGILSRRPRRSGSPAENMTRAFLRTPSLIASARPDSGPRT